MTGSPLAARLDRAWRALGPMTREEWSSVLRRAQLGFARHRGLESVAALTWFSAVSLFPIGVTGVSALALVSRRQQQTAETLLIVLERVAPPALVDGVRGPLSELDHLPAPGLGLVVGLLLTLWTVSSYATCFGSALNAFYEVPEGRPLWRLRAAMLLVAVPLVVCGAIAALLTLLTPAVARALGDQLAVGEPWLSLLQVLKWPVIGFLIITMLAQLYLWTPNVQRHRVTLISWSAGAAIVGWALASGGFVLYIASIAHYDVVYGSLGGAVVLLLWIWLSNLVLVFGASVDTEMVRMRLLRAGVAAERRIRVPERDTRRSRALDDREARAERASRRVRAGHDVYGDAVGSARRDEDEPSLAEVEHDFAMPEDADLTDDVGGGDETAGDGSR